MIQGLVSADGVPTVTTTVAGVEWPAVIDTGFNGDLELPRELIGSVEARYVGRVRSSLAGSQTVEEDLYLVEFPFDGKALGAEATFVATSEILIGTNFLRDYYLQVRFKSRTVQLIRELSASGS